VAALVFFALAGRCASASPASTLHIIPLPHVISRSPGEYRVPSSLTIVARDPDETNVGSFLSSYAGSAGLTASIQAASSDATSIRLSDRANDSSLGPEGYRLTVDAAGVAIDANGGAGLFYGVQTLEQMYPQPAAGGTIPYVHIVDWPQYKWRGIHLDVSRHFFPVSVVKQYIDLASHYKLNVFHWHLTDDQGWRIEIKKYPKLTKIGGCRDGSQVGGEGSTVTDGRRYCGYYAQDDIRDVVAYARARYVAIVPEIEGPGHSVAAVSAYPWLGCDGRQYPVRELWGVSTQIFCPTERTFGFLDDVIGEVSSLFPGEYIHIGGDEVPHDAWEASSYVTALRTREHLASYDAVQGYFTRRVELIAAKHHKRIVGWDEILNGGVSPQATVMAWRGPQHGVDAAKRGNDVVMSPDGLLYFDAAQGNEDLEPLSIGGLTTLEMVYDYDPMPPGLTTAQAAHILGAQGNLWAEYVPTADHLFYMLLPREIALSEVCWTSRSQMNWDDFTTRLDAELSRLENQGYHYRIPNVLFGIDSSGFEFREQ
jgi:hexosaminidase